MPYTGKDVVVGLIDAGFDYTHVTLFDTTGNNYRVKKIWEQKKPGVPPSQFFYGNELVNTSDMFMAKTDAYGFSHGTHVAGIAGGSGFGSDGNNSRFRGMAYESDLVLVGITPTEYSWTSTGLSDIIDAISYIFSYAAVNGKPAVANLSWGCSIGPHDGSSLFSQACDNLTGTGKIFVCSGGNNGQNKVHFNLTFTGADTVINTLLALPDVLGEKRAWVDAWGDTGQAFCLQASLYSGGSFLQTVGNYCSDAVNSGVYDMYMIGTNNDTCFISITTDSATYNSKPRIFMDIYNKTTDDLILTLRGTSGTVNMWTGYVKNKTGYYGSFNFAP
jgi:subtilisin family serine protease